MPINSWADKKKMCDKLTQWNTTQPLKKSRWYLLKQNLLIFKLELHTIWSTPLHLPASSNHNSSLDFYEFGFVRFLIQVIGQWRSNVRKVKETKWKECFHSSFKVVKYWHQYAGISHKCILLCLEQPLWKPYLKIPTINKAKFSHFNCSGWKPIKYV